MKTTYIITVEADEITQDMKDEVYSSLVAQLDTDFTGLKGIVTEYEGDSIISLAPEMLEMLKVVKVRLEIAGLVDTTTDEISALISRAEGGK